MNDTSVISVRPKMSRNVVRIETIAMIRGTRAMNEANTNASTTSAPIPPNTASMSTPGPPLLAPVPLARIWVPVRCTGAPAIVLDAAAARAASIDAAPTSTPTPPIGASISAKVVRPSAETNPRSPVET